MCKLKAFVAVFPDGRTLITDYGHHRVLVINKDGSKIELLAGTGKEGNTLDPVSKRTELKHPSGVAVFPDSKLLIADTGNNRVLCVTNGDIE